MATLFNTESMPMKTLADYIESLKAIVSPLTAFFAGTLLTCMAYALLSSTLALRLADNHVSTSAAGIILSIYYVGYIFASMSSYKIINKVGHIRAFSTYISVLSALVLGHAISPNPIYWGGLRLLEGYCLGSAFMCLESWLNTRSNNKNRGMLMALYMITSYLGAGFGQLMLNIPDGNGVIIYILVSVIYSIALVPISLTALPSPDLQVHKDIQISYLYKIAPVGVVGCICSGVFVGGFYTLGAIYTHQIGLNLEQTSIFMFFGLLGGLAAQFPLGRLSDRFDRRFILMWICGILFFIAPWVHLFIDEGTVYLALAAMALGCGTFTIYPISVAHVNDLISDGERIHAAGMLILLQSLGMIFGPVIVSFCMQNCGAISFLLSYSIVAGFFVVYTFKHIVTKPDVGYVSNTKTDLIPAAPTHAFNTLAQDDTLLGKAKELFADKKH